MQRVLSKRCWKNRECPNCGHLWIGLHYGEGLEALARSSPKRVFVMEPAIRVKPLRGEWNPFRRTPIRHCRHLGDALT